MEMIDGETLPTLMRKFHPLPLPRAYACAVIREVGAGLAHAHDRRVIQRRFEAAKCDGDEHGGTAHT